MKGLWAWVKLNPSVTIIVVTALVVAAAIAQNSWGSKARIAQERERASVPGRAIEPDDHYRGSLEAPVQIVVYMDLECPYCKKLHKVNVPLLKARYGDQIAFVYRHYPLTRIHPTARQAAEAAECAGIVGGEEKFWGFVEEFFAFSEPPSPVLYPQLAERVLVDVQRFKACVDQGESVARVERDIADARLVGVSMTPTQVVVGGKKPVIVRGSNYVALQQAIDAVLEIEVVTEMIDGI